MKISELNTKSFLGNSGAAANSYVLVNYAEAANGTPVTYKASLEELGKSIAANLGLIYDGTYGHGGQVLKVSNGAYAADDSEKVVGLAGSNTLRLVVDGGFVPGVLQINDTEDGFGYYATSESDSWTPVTLGGDGGEGDETIDVSALTAEFTLPTSGGLDISGATVAFYADGDFVVVDDCGFAFPFPWSTAVTAKDKLSNNLQIHHVFYADSVGLVTVNNSNKIETLISQGLYDDNGDAYPVVVYDSTNSQFGFIDGSNIFIPIGANS